jgi:catechol 2,3-dioxygenase-like lactoylglutathione lyase family enzyme
MRLDHVQVAAPLGCEDEARAFYGGVLGLSELEKPASLASRGGVWFEHLHVGVEDPFTPARKAHPAFVVADLDALASRLGEVQWDDAVPGVRRFYASDPFGNRLEFVDAADHGRMRDVSLLVRVVGRDREDELPIPPEFSAHEELTRFLNRSGSYAQLWIRLGSGEYVRYDHILSVRIGPEDSLHSGQD